MIFIKDDQCIAFIQPLVEIDKIPQFLYTLEQTYKHGDDVF